MQQAAERLRGIKAFALDMDGTIYLGERLFPFTRAFLARVSETGRQSFFLTNNSSKSTSAYVQKLARMGIAAEPGRIVTSAHATISLLMRRYPGKRVTVLGTEALMGEFAQAGVLLDDESPEAAVLAFDTELTYPKLCKFCDGVRAGLPYIATHPDLNCPTEAGFIPDAGSFMELIRASTGRMPELIAGKPHRPIVDELLVRTGLEAHEIAMVGDRLYTDIKTGLDHKLLSILVLTGETDEKMLKKSEIRPDLVFGSLEDMIGLM